MMQDTIFATVPLNEFKHLILQCMKEAMSNTKDEAQHLNNKDEILEIAQAADYLHCSTAKLYKMTSERAIPFTKPARKVLFKKSDLDAYLANSEKPSKSQVMVKVMQNVPFRKGKT